MHAFADFSSGIQCPKPAQRPAQYNLVLAVACFLSQACVLPDLFCRCCTDRLFWHGLLWRCLVWPVSATNEGALAAHYASMPTQPWRVSRRKAFEPLRALPGALDQPFQASMNQSSSCCALSSQHGVASSAHLQHTRTPATHALVGCGVLMVLLFHNRVCRDTEGNIMVNDLVQGTAGTAILYSCMLVYLALGMTTTQYALRQSLDLIIVGEGAQFTWRRHVSAASSKTVKGPVPAPAASCPQATTGIVCVLCGGVFLLASTSSATVAAKMPLLR